MTTCNGASVNRTARCGERKTFEFREERDINTHTQDINPQTCARYKYLLQISTCSNLVLHHALCLLGEEQYCIITLFKMQGHCQHCD